jgi:hypothetical protein
MPLSSARLALAFRSKLLARAWCTQSGPELEQFCADLAEAVVLEITANAVVLPLLLVAPPGGGPVTGTGKVQ